MEKVFEVEGPLETRKIKRKTRRFVLLSLAVLVVIVLFINRRSPPFKGFAMASLDVPKKQKRWESIMQNHYSVEYIPPLYFPPLYFLIATSCPLRSAVVSVHRDAFIVQQWRIQDPCSRSDLVVQPPRDAMHVDTVQVSVEFTNPEEHQRHGVEYDTLTVSFSDDMVSAKIADSLFMWYQRQSAAFCALHSINSVLINEFNHQACPLRSMTELITPIAAEPIAVALSEQLNGGMFDSGTGNYDARVLMPLFEKAVTEMNAQCGVDGMAVVLQQVWYHFDGEPAEVDAYGIVLDGKKVWGYRELEATLVPYFDIEYNEDRVRAVHKSVELIRDGLHYYALGFTLKKDSDRESFGEWLAREWRAKSHQQLALICKDAGHFFALMRANGVWWANLNSLFVEQRTMLMGDINLQALNCEFLFAIVKPLSP